MSGKEFVFLLVGLQALVMILCFTKVIRVEAALLCSKIIIIAYGIQLMLEIPTWEIQHQLSFLTWCCITLFWWQLFRREN